MFTLNYAMVFDVFSLESGKNTSGLRMDFRPESGRNSGTICLGTPLCPCGITYHGCYDSVYSRNPFKVRCLVSENVVIKAFRPRKLVHNWIFRSRKSVHDRKKWYTIGLVIVQHLCGEFRWQQRLESKHCVVWQGRLSSSWA